MNFKRTLWTASLLWGLTLTGCVFDASPLTARNCTSDDDCADGQSCLDGYCGVDDGNGPVTPCNDDADCDDGIFCNGVETCSPQAPGADDAGCLNGEDPTLDDGVACTRDLCDEDSRQTIHVPGDDCECISENDDACQALAQNACEQGRCDLQTFTCVVDTLEEGDPCDDGFACTTGSTCDAQGSCGGGQPDNAACDDELFCNGVEVCAPQDPDADDQGCLAGAPPDPDDDDRCTDDICDENNDQLINPPNDVCGCVEDEQCRPSNPADVNDCLLYLCGPDNTCITTPLEQNTVCDDGVACTDSDVCDGQGRCQGVPLNTRCDDDLFCTGDEFCDPQSDLADERGCIQGQPPLDTLPDQPQCVEASCDEQNDELVFNTDDCGCPGGDASECPTAPACQFYVCTQDFRCELQNSDERTRCDDGVSCTNGDACDGDGACVPGTALDSECDNGAFCDGQEVCEPAHPQADDETGCRTRDVPALDDEIPCTQDLCDEDNDVITHTPNDNFCDDGVFCDGVETCDPGLGCVEGNPLDVDDDIPCTTDACDEANDVITHTPNDALCDNGLFCDGTEVCDPDAQGAVEGCVSVNPPSLEDDVPCTIGACDEDNDTITQTPNDALCDNGLFCDGAEVCDPDAQGAVEGCVAGEAILVDDGIPCTADACDEDNDTITHTPNDALCDNGDFCDGAEVCDPDAQDAVEGCAGGEPLENGTACGTLECNGVQQDASCQAGACVLTPEGPTGDERCDDGQDNDCDGDFDGNDSDCRTPNTLTLTGPDDASAGLDEEGALLNLTTEFGNLPVTSQTENLYCVSRIVAEEVLFEQAPQEAVTFLDQGNNDPENLNSVSFGEIFSNNDTRLGARLCDGMSMILGPYDMPALNQGVVDGLILTVNMGNQEGELEFGQHLVLSYRTGRTGDDFLPLAAIGNLELERMATLKYHLFNGPRVEQIEIRFQVIDVFDGDATGACGFIESLRLERSPVVTLADDGQRLHPEWTYNDGAVTEAAIQNFQTVDANKFLETFIPLPMLGGNNNRSTNDEASIAGDNKGLRYRFKNDQPNFGFGQFPEITQAPDFDRANPLLMDFHYAMGRTDLSQNEISHIEFGANSDPSDIFNYPSVRLASALSENLDSYSFYGSHYDLDSNNTALENRFVVVLPEEAKPMLDRQLGITMTSVDENDERTFVDELSVYVHTAPTAVDVNVTPLGPAAFDEPDHELRLRHARPGTARVQCFWQIPGDPDTLTLASEPIEINFSP